MNGLLDTIRQLPAEDAGTLVMLGVLLFWLFPLLVWSLVQPMVRWAIRLPDRYRQTFDRRKPWGDARSGLERMWTRNPQAPRVGGEGCYVYWCKCGDQLQEGPVGGCAVNAVCRRCHINYGCLPGFTFGSGEWAHSRRTRKKP